MSRFMNMIYYFLIVVVHTSLIVFANEEATTMVENLLKKGHLPGHSAPNQRQGTPKVQIKGERKTSLLARNENNKDRILDQGSDNDYTTTTTTYYYYNEVDVVSEDGSAEIEKVADIGSLKEADVVSKDGSAGIGNVAEIESLKEVDFVSEDGSAEIENVAEFKSLIEVDNHLDEKEEITGLMEIDIQTRHKM